MEKDGREDASSALSDYSSCGESEIERYSSANSLLGASSLCSSVGNHSEYLDCLGGSAGGDDLDSSNGREKLLKSSSRSADGANSDGLDCLYNGIADCQRGSCSKLEEDQVFWGSRIRIWSKSFMGLNGTLGRQMNGEKDGLEKKDVPLSTISCSSQENDAAFCNRESSDDFFLKELQETSCEDTHGFYGKVSYSCQESSSGRRSCSASLSGESAESNRGALDGEDSTLDNGIGAGVSYRNDNLVDRADKKGSQLMCNKKIAGLHMEGDPAGLLVSESKLASIPLLDNMALDFSSSRVCQVDRAEVIDDHDLTKMGEKNSLTDEVKKLDADECLDEIFFDIEEILLDSGISHLPKNRQGNHGCKLKHSHNFRDGSSTASTSLAHQVYPLIQYPAKIDSVQVVGTKQKRGEVSFGERLIGVKEYTVYKLRVRSGNDQWEVERRYRDFFSLYCQLNTLFLGHDLPLPSPWSKVENESRKYFGSTSQNVVNERTILIQDCLSSTLNYNAPFGIPSSLVWFLSPSKDLCKSSLLNILVPESHQRLRDEVNLNSSHCDDISTLSKELSLVVDVVPQKSINQLLEKQHYVCAGCDRFLDAGKTLMKDFVWMLGWGRPRLCEYTGQIFCTLCHTGDTSVLPAKILHHWDFALCPVSRLAKVYLESIHDKPVLCLRAVNPSLFAKVPALLHVINIRKKIESMLPFVRCSFRNSVERGLGSRKYLLENNGFFALRDLVDISKGAFAGLPAIVETVSSKILDHIMQQCPICYDIGIPCAARESCRATSPLIFPFEEAEVIRCTSCGIIFHEFCIWRLDGCPCGELITEHLKASLAEARRRGGDIELDGFVDSPVQNPNSKSPAGFISELLSMARPEKLWQPRNRSPVLLMDFLQKTLSL